MSDGTWKVARHAPIEQINERIWRVVGPLDGMPLKRVMTVVKRADGKLMVHSAIQLDETSMAEIEEWGTLAYIVVPNGFHRMGAPAFKQRFPNASVVCPQGSRARVEKVVAVDADYADVPADEAVTLQILDGVGDSEGVMLIRADDGVTLVMNDALFNTPHRTGFAGFVLKHVTQSTGHPRVSRLFKVAAIKNKQAFKACLLRLADTPDLRRIVVSHHEVIDADPGGALRQAASEL